jgi:hypothetical protein
MKRLPSEYWAQNCAVAASVMRFTDVACRNEIGVEKLMFGSDFPHMESTWPNTLDFIRTTLGAVPEDEARMILGGNAIDFYHLDRATLSAAALRCGPLPEDVLGEHVVDPRIVDHFDSRAGLRKSPQLHEARLAAAVTEDIERIERELPV